jgi:hypothetical protein
MFLKCSTCKKDGKTHRSWSVVQSRRVGRGVGQRHVLYLGEFNDSQRAAWQKAVEVCDDSSGRSHQCALFRMTARRRTPTHPPCRCGWINSSSSAPVPGARAGWAISSGASCDSTPSSPRGSAAVDLADKPWQQVRDQLRVKLLPPEGEVYVLAESGARTHKERAMRRRKLKALWQRLKEIQRQDLTRDQRLEKLGAARDRAGRAGAALVQTTVDAEGQLAFTLDRKMLRTVRGREGRYLLRTNLSADNPELLWRCYMQLVFVEEAFRTLKGDLGLRPIYHHRADRIEAHLFVAFLV